MSKLQKAGWRLPPPNYPATALFIGNRGNILLWMRTDAKGHLAKATIIKVDRSANSRSLRSTVLLWA